MQDGNAKQLLSESIKGATNILVTVSRNPSVDELSAALALTLMLNKLDKHATAVFSGVTPPAIKFLKPEKTFEGTVDSLRDFIIALDKNKADRLRYKVEDDVVRIFITPYRTIISEKDLAFSQGDFNVELIIALGVEKSQELDAAITAHGRILHDATVVTINTNDRQSGLGTIDWTDPTASSFCEMLMSLSESLRSGIIDIQIATSLLTGIVAATERFSNTKTTPKVMTMAAQLMAAGANQQLIATKLREGHELPVHHEPTSDDAKKSSEETNEKSKKSDKKSAKKNAQASEKQPADGEMQIEHKRPTNAELAFAKATELANNAEAEAETVTDDKDAESSTTDTEPNSDTDSDADSVAKEDDTTADETSSEDSADTADSQEANDKESSDHAEASDEDNESHENETSEDDQNKDEDENEDAAEETSENTEDELDSSKSVTPTLSVEDLKKDIVAASEEVEQAAQGPLIETAAPDVPRPSTSSWGKDSFADTSEIKKQEEEERRTFGDTLNAITDRVRQAKESRNQRRNRTLLGRDETGSAQAPINAVSPGAINYEPPTIDPFANRPLKSEPASPLHYEPIETHAPKLEPLPASDINSDEDSTEIDLQESDKPHLTDLEEQAHGTEGEEAPLNPVTDARAAVNAALDTFPADSPSVSLDPIPQPPQAFPVMTDPIDMPANTPADAKAPSPPLPDFSTLPPLPGDPVTPFDAPAPPQVSDMPVPAPPKNNDPAQFRLPGAN